MRQTKQKLEKAGPFRASVNLMSSNFSGLTRHIHRRWFRLTPPQS
jgi:hypothetical protein